MNVYNFVELATLGAVFPYVAVAALGWVENQRTRRSGKSGDVQQVRPVSE